MNVFKLFFGFLIITVIAISGAIYTIMIMDDYTKNTQNMYRHPFTVSNETANIETNIMTIHRDMKDIVLTKDTIKIISIIEEIKHEEEKALNSFKVIKKYYLGDPARIDEVKKLFVGWKPIRNEVIKLVFEDKRDEAIHITQNKAKKYIDDLAGNIHTLKEFAYTKANKFYTDSLDDNGVQRVVIIFVSTLIASAIIIIFIVRNLLSIASDSKKQLSLIDQNILMAKFSPDMKIIEISNALCSVLHKKKKEVLETEDKFFFTNPVQFSEFEYNIFSGQDFKGDVYIDINGHINWFAIEIFPEMSTDMGINSFSIFLTNINDKKKIEQTSTVDALTGLFNRGHFDKEFANRLLLDDKIKIIMLDIDYFKQYNDFYGHKDGDEALIKVSNIIKANANKKGESAFRVGGEEFIIISEASDLEQLKKQTQKIIDEVLALEVTHKGSELEIKQLSISAGLLIEDITSETNEDYFYKKVDKKLYEAKNAGRNQLAF